MAHPDPLLLLGQARIQLGNAVYWAEQGDRKRETLASLLTLAIQLREAARAIASEMPGAQISAHHTGENHV